MARTIKRGGRTGRSYYYVSQTGEVTTSSNPNVKVGSNVYDDGVLKNPNRPTEDDDNRVRNIVGDLIGIETPDELMSKILEAVKDSVTPVPIPGKFYTYIYIAETPNIRYDQHPLIACTNIFTEKENIYFIGFNYHWGDYRKYRLDRTVGQLYEVYAGEISDLREISYGKFLNT
tara:strand:+ start:375 stop:896 length:522 start_codon:yes stop_codon:yes gene_type:complete